MESGQKNGNQRERAEIDAVLAEMAEDGELVASEVFRRARHGSYEVVNVASQFAEAHEKFLPLRRLLIEIPGGHLVIASEDVVGRIRESKVRNEVQGLWVRFDTGRFAGAVGRVIGAGHEAELAPWIGPREQHEYMKCAGTHTEEIDP